MKFKPHPYQDIMIEQMLAHERTNIWAGMGMGKTVSTLTALDCFALDRGAPSLVIAPLRVARTTWPDEVAKWDHLSHMRVVPVLGDPGARAAALRRKADVYTINYDNIPWLVDHLGNDWPFDTVVADESTRLKGFRLHQGTKRAKALAKVAHSRTRRWINLTGTPAPNGLLDLWGQQWFVDRGEALGYTYDGYVNRWFQRLNEKKNLSGGETFNVPIIRPCDWAQTQIQDRMRDTTISLNPKDYFDLDDPIVKEVKVKLPVKARSLYRDMERRMFMELDGFEVEAFQAANKSAKCLQIASGAAFVDDTGQWREIHDEKLQALESILEEAAGSPVLVAYHWKPDLARIKQAFPFARQLDNDTQTIRDWNAGKIKMLLAHPQSAGHGLSLQDGGNILVYFSYWWDLECHDQIMERIGPVRQKQSGHDRPVWVYYIVAEDTVDEDVLLRHVSKRSVQDILTDAMKRKGYAP